MRENGISKDERSNLIPDPCAVFSSTCPCSPGVMGVIHTSQKQEIRVLVLVLILLRLLVCGDEVVKERI